MRYIKDLPEENFTKTSHELDSFVATVSVCFEAKGARDGNLTLCLYIYIYVLNCPKHCLKIRIYIHAIARAYIVSVIGYMITIKIMC